MTDEELHAKMKDYAMSWKVTGPILEAERWKKVRQTDTAHSLALLGSLFDSAVWLHPPSVSSGLVEQQRIFMKARQ